MAASSATYPRKPAGTAGGAVPANMSTDGASAHVGRTAEERGLVEDMIEAAKAGAASVEAADAVARQIQSIRLDAAPASVSVAQTDELREWLHHIDTLPESDQVLAKENSRRFARIVRQFHLNDEMWIQDDYIPHLELALLPRSIAAARQHLDDAESGTLDIGRTIQLMRTRDRGPAISTLENAVYDCFTLFKGDGRITAGVDLTRSEHVEHGEALLDHAAAYPAADMICAMPYVGAAANGLGGEDVIAFGVHGRNFSDYLQCLTLVRENGGQDRGVMKTANLQTLLGVLAEPKLGREHFGAIRVEANKVTLERWRQDQLSSGKSQIVVHPDGQVDLTGLTDAALLGAIYDAGVRRVLVPRGRLGDDVNLVANGPQGDLEAASAGPFAAGPLLLTPAALIDRTHRLSNSKFPGSGIPIVPDRYLNLVAAAFKFLRDGSAVPPESHARIMRMLRSRLRVPSWPSDGPGGSQYDTSMSGRIQNGFGKQLLPSGPRSGCVLTIDAMDRRPSSKADHDRTPAQLAAAARRISNFVFVSNREITHIQGLGQPAARVIMQAPFVRLQSIVRSSSTLSLAHAPPPALVSSHLGGAFFKRGGTWSRAESMLHVEDEAYVMLLGDCALDVLDGFEEGDAISVFRRRHPDEYARLGRRRALTTDRSLETVVNALAAQLMCDEGIAAEDAALAAKARLQDSDCRFTKRPILTSLIVDKDGRPDMAQPLIMVDFTKDITIVYEPCDGHSVRFTLGSMGTDTTLRAGYVRIAVRPPFDIVFYSPSGEPLVDCGVGIWYCAELVLSATAGQRRSLEDGRAMITALESEASGRTDAPAIDFGLFHDKRRARNHLAYMNASAGQLRRYLRKEVNAQPIPPDYLSTSLSYSLFVIGPLDAGLLRNMPRAHRPPPTLLHSSGSLTLSVLGPRELVSSKFPGLHGYMNQRRIPVGWIVLERTPAGVLGMRAVEPEIDDEGYVVPSSRFIEVAGTSAIFARKPLSSAIDYEARFLKLPSVRRLIDADNARGATWAAPT